MPMDLNWRFRHGLAWNSNPNPTLRPPQKAKTTGTQRYSPLSFCSGSFNKTRRMVYFRERSGFHHDFCGFQELPSCWRPSFRPFNASKQHHFPFRPTVLETRSKRILERNSYSYICFHISGLDNVWADVINRWKQLADLSKYNHCEHRCIEKIYWPPAKEEAQLQQMYSNFRPQNMKLCDGLWKTSHRAIWVPDEAKGLQLRLFVIPHTSATVYKSRKATRNSLHQQFEWKTLLQDFHAFLNAFITAYPQLGVKMSLVLSAQPFSLC